MTIEDSVKQSMWGFWTLVFLLAGCFLMLSQAFLKKKRTGWRVWYFNMAGIINTSGLVALIACALPQYAAAEQMMQFYYSVNILAVSGFCLHVYVQTMNQKPVRLLMVLCLYIPVVLAVVRLVSAFILPFSTGAARALDTACHLLVFGMVACMCRYVCGYFVRFLHRTPQHCIFQLLAIGAVLVPALYVPFSQMSYTRYPDGLWLPLLLCQVLAQILLYIGQLVEPAERSMVASYGFVMENLSTMVLMLDDKERILDWNEKLGQSPLPLPCRKESFASYRKRIVDEGYCTVSPHNENIVVLMQDDREMQYLISVNKASNGHKAIGHLVEISEVTSLYSIISYFREAATMDHLTGLHNRNAYEKMVQIMMSEGNMPLLVMVGDVNGLKRINDTQGHLKGDKLLQMTAARLQAAAPAGAFMARLGGDEFVLLLPRGTIADADNLIEQMRLVNWGAPRADSAPPSISWGYSIVQSANDDYDKAFAKADGMMYQRKTRWYQSHSVERRGERHQRVGS